MFGRALKKIKESNKSLAAGGSGSSPGQGSSDKKNLSSSHLSLKRSSLLKF